MTSPRQKGLHWILKRGCSSKRSSKRMVVMPIPWQVMRGHSGRRNISQKTLQQLNTTGCYPEEQNHSILIQKLLGTNRKLIPIMSKINPLIVIEVMSSSVKCLSSQGFSKVRCALSAESPLDARRNLLSIKGCILEKNHTLAQTVGKVSAEEMSWLLIREYTLETNPLVAQTVGKASISDHI